MQSARLSPSAMQWTHKLLRVRANVLNYPHTKGLTEYRDSVSHPGGNGHECCACTGAMRLIDILVIYLTVGAPVAAVAFLRELSRSKNTARSAFGFFWTLVLWPFFAVFEISFMG